MITHGVYQLLPELEQCEVTYSVEIPYDETEKYVSNADYVIHAGTPSWMTLDNRRFWKACIKYKKHIAMLGIGLAVPYHFDMWYGVEDFVQLKDADLIDIVICRDKFCYYWVKRLGYSHSKIHLLPCPGFFISSETKTVTNKKNVVLSIASIDETAHQTEHTFQKYYEKKKYVLDELRKKEANVELMYQRNLSLNKYAMLDFDKWFPNETIHSFNNKESYLEYIKGKDVYIGVRNHGALSCAGLGIPSLLMGTDYRQYLADEIPFIHRMDISYADWNPTFLFTWYDSLMPESINRSLVAFKDIAREQWQNVLKSVKGIIG